MRDMLIVIVVSVIAILIIMRIAWGARADESDSEE